MASVTRKSVSTGRSYLLGAVAVVLSILVTAAHFFGGADTLLETSAFVAAFCMLAVATTLGTRGRHLTRGMAIVVVGAAVWFSLGFGGTWHEARQEVLALVGAAAVWVTAYAVGNDRWSLSVSWRTLIIGLMVFALLSLLAYLFHLQDVSARDTLIVMEQLHSTFASPNTAATVMALALLVAVGRALYLFRNSDRQSVTRNDRINYVMKAGLIPSVLALVTAFALPLTASRAGLLVGLVTVFVLVLIDYLASREHKKKRSRPIRFTVLTLLALSSIAAIGIWLNEALGWHWTDLFDHGRDRLEMYRIYVAFWAEAPLFGHGLGSFDRLNDAAMTLDNARVIGDASAAHNVILQWLIQQGIVGTSLMAVLILILHVPIFRALARRDVETFAFLLMVCCVSGLIFLHGQIDYGIEIPSVLWTYCLLLGLAAGRSKRSLKRVRRGAEPSAEDDTIKTDPAQELAPLVRGHG